MSEVIKPSWLPEGLYQQWLIAFQDAGGTGVVNAANTATESVRSSPEYDSYFPGLRREDGSLRYEYNPEATYYNNIESFRNAVEGVGVNAGILEEEYIDLIEGDVSPQEFTQRVNVLYDRVLSAGSDIRNWYGEEWGIDMTNSGIIASLMSDRVGTAVLEKRLTMAEIGGEAASRNFDLTTQFVDMLEAEGMNRADADRLFGSAESMLPVLGALAARHGDIDDTFDITEYAEGAFLQDPEQSRRIQRLAAQESSTFTGGAQVDITRSRETGGLTGLADV